MIYVGLSNYFNAICHFPDNNEKKYKRMKILQIGGTGFLGSRIAKKLLEHDHDLTIITRNTQKEMPFDVSKVTLIGGSILQPEKLDFDEKFDIIVYTAMVPFTPGRISDKKFKELELLTKQYFENTIDLAKRLHCPLILTSGASYQTKGNEVADESYPITRKGMAALGKCYDEMIDQVKSENSIPLIEMLPAQIYGLGGMFDKMINMAKNGKIVLLGGGKNFMPRVHVDDCANAYVLAIEKMSLGQRFIICDDSVATVKEFMIGLGQMFGAKKIITIPKPVLRMVMGKHIYNTLTMNTKVSNQRIKKELGWEPVYTTYREGFKTLL